MNFSTKKRNKNILVIDDETDVLDLLKLYLESQGWQVITISSPLLAFDELRKQAFFLIITDIAMPDLDGYELLAEIKKLRVPSQITLITGFGYNPDHTLVKINKEHSYPIVFKPFEFKKPKLKEIVRRAWEEYHKDLAP